MKKIDELHQRLRPLYFSLLAIAFAFVFGGILIAISGINPFAAYAAMFKGAFGSMGSISQVLNRSTPLIFTGLAVLIGLKVKSINIGAEGQFIIGAFFAALAGAYLSVGVAVIDILIVLVAGIIGGGLWAIVPATLRIKRGVNTIISTIMMNYVAIAIVAFLLLDFLTVRGTDLVATKWMAETARLPLVIPSPARLGLGFFLALLVVGIVYVIMEKTVLGYEIKVVGQNAIAGAVSGISSTKRIITALILSGALAGIGGAIEISGVFYRYYDNYNPGYGFTGIPVAILARGNPVAIILTALLFSILRVGAISMQTSVGVSRTIVDAMQGVIIMFIAGEYIFTLMKKKHQLKKIRLEEQAS